ncbi:restriction endonuclease subunit S [Pseudomonas aeruginosa]|uniref:restriction endonuclease subunit S n=1 Tax=Pseudomonas aeruginosa TaxID=287 RepID=UPI003CCB0A87
MQPPGVLKSWEIPLPPLPEQKRIAAILDKADSIRRKRQQAIQLADDFLRSVFLDMFGDPVTNPKGWPLKRFGEVGTWSSGGTPSRAISDFFEGEINWYSAGELNSRYLDGSVEKISESGRPQKLSATPDHFGKVLPHVLSRTQRHRARHDPDRPVQWLQPAQACPADEPQPLDGQP